MRSTPCPSRHPSHTTGRPPPATLQSRPVHCHRHAPCLGVRGKPCRLCVGRGCCDARVRLLAQHASAFCPQTPAPITHAPVLITRAPVTFTKRTLYLFFQNICSKYLSVRAPAITPCGGRVGALQAATGPVMLALAPSGGATGERPRHLPSPLGPALLACRLEPCPVTNPIHASRYHSWHSLACGCAAWQQRPLPPALA